MRTLYPSIKPYEQHRLAVVEPHELYIEESGNADGVPVLFVHGGPGAGCSVDDRRFFDPSIYRIILFDQRGAGKSTPHASLEHNDTPALIEDIESIRQFLGIKQWCLFGGSWGSTLSLLYAQAYPAHVLGMILRGIFLCREKDLSWFYHLGASEIFPEFWSEFVHPIPEAERENLIAAYYERLTGEDELARMGAAKHWAEWEGRCATLDPNKGVVGRFTHPHTAMSLSRIEAHYFHHNTFINENQIIDNIAAIQEIPGVIVHGRYDVICPLENAYALHQHWPNSELQIVRDAGHASIEPGIIDALIKATDEMGKELSR